ncbi:hypothetical protein GCM10010182_06430 [Actinomadura cremea]|nr:hypothetical protein GCM10010182_06430 [Actinomadura cremea]
MHDRPVEVETEAEEGAALLLGGGQGGGQGGGLGGPLSAGGASRTPPGTRSTRPSAVTRRHSAARSAVPSPVRVPMNASRRTAPSPYVR